MRRWQVAILGAAISTGIAWSLASEAIPPEAKAEPGRVTGRVVEGDDDRPVAGALVSFDLDPTARPSSATVETRADGSFEAKDLPPGLYSIAVTHAEFVPAEGAVSIEVEQGKSVVAPPIRLVRGLEIAGIVRDADTREPIPGVEIVMQLEERSPWNPMYPGGKRIGTTAADGRAIVRGLAMGSHEASFGARGYLRASLSPIQVELESPEFEIALERGPAVSGRVFDSEGRPAANAVVFLDLRSVPDSEEARCFETETTADALGRYRLEGIPPFGGTIMLLARHEGHAISWKCDVVVGSDGVDIALSRGWSIRGTVRTEDGKPSPGATVAAEVQTCGIDTITPEAAILSGREYRRVEADARGEYEFHHLAGECYEVSAWAEGLLPGRVSVRSREREDETAESLGLYLRRGRSVRGRVVDAKGLPIARASVSTSDWWARDDVETREDGTFAIQGIGKARALLKASLEGYEDAECTVFLDSAAPGTTASGSVREDVRIVLLPLARISGRIRGPEGFAETKGLRLCVDGVEQILPEGHRERFELTLRPGAHTVGAFHAESPGLISSKVERVTLAPGEEREDIVLDLVPEAVIRGKVIERGLGEPVSDAYIVFLSLEPSGPCREASSREDGSFTLERLPPGAFELRVSGAKTNAKMRATQPLVRDRLRAGETRDLVLEFTPRGRLEVDISAWRGVSNPPGIEAWASLSPGLGYGWPRSPNRDHRFVFSELAPGSYGLFVWGRQAGTWSFRIETQVRIAEGETTRLVPDEPRIVQVEGRLRIGDQPLAGYRLTIQEPWRDTWRYTGLLLHESWAIAGADTDADGQWRTEIQEGGPYLIRLESAESRENSWMELSLPRSVETAQVDLALGAGQMQALAVEEGTSIPVANVRVEVFDASRPRASWLSHVRARRSRTTTDAQGRFRVSHLRPGLYSIRIGCLHQDGGSWTHGVQIDGVNTTQVRVPVDEGLTRKIRILDQGGLPVDEAGLILRDTEGNLVADPVRDEDDSNRRHDALSLPSMPPGSYEVTVVHPDLAPVRLAIEIDETSGLWTATLTPGGSLEARVASPTGGPIAEATLRLIGPDGRDVFDDRIPEPSEIANPFLSPTTPLSGAITLGHLRPGRYLASASKGTVRSPEVGVEILEGKAAQVSLTLEGQ